VFGLTLNLAQSINSDSYGYVYSHESVVNKQINDKTDRQNETHRDRTCGTHTHVHHNTHVNLNI